MEQEHTPAVVRPVRVPWIKGKLVGAKPPLGPNGIGLDAAKFGTHSL